MKSRAGFSLLEMMIGLTILILVILASSAILTQTTVGIRRAEIGTSSMELLRGGMQYFIPLLQTAGGNQVRSWVAIGLEDNPTTVRLGLPDGEGADRLTLIRLNTAVAPCEITESWGLGSPTPKIRVRNTAGTCCIGAAQQNQQAVFTRTFSNVYNYAPRYLKTFNALNCEMTIEELIQVPNLADLRVLPPADVDPLSGFRDGWSTGFVTIVTVDTFFVDPSTRELKRGIDADNDGTISASEMTTVLDHVVDLQVAVGYDSNPADGRVVERTDPADRWNDEWLGNFDAADTRERRGAGGLATALPSDMRAAQVGLIIGDRLVGNGTPTPLRILNGPVRQIPGMSLHSQSTLVTLKNIFLFQ
ncbi:MAG: PilW family protein [Bacteriovoracia bacterium]